MCVSCAATGNSFTDRQCDNSEDLNAIQALKYKRTVFSGKKITPAGEPVSKSRGSVQRFRNHLSTSFPGKCSRLYCDSIKELL